MSSSLGLFANVLTLGYQVALTSTSLLALAARVSRPSFIYHLLARVVHPPALGPQKNIFFQKKKIQNGINFFKKRKKVQY
jgi:hypothetical protein